MHSTRKNLKNQVQTWIFSGVLPLILILLLGSILRFKGLHWGLPFESLRHESFHPDETYVALVLQQVDVLQLRGHPDAAHNEGTLLYYIWTLGSLILYGLKITTTLPPYMNLNDLNYAKLIYMGRFVGCLLDLLSIVMVFLILRKTTKHWFAPVFGALALALYPYQLVYGHFMRPHVGACFFVLLVIWASLDLYEQRVWTERYEIKKLFKIGILVGLSIAARYTYGAVALLFPLTLLIYRKLAIQRLPQLNAKNLVNVLINKSFISLGLGSVLGLFLGDPFLFLKFGQARLRMAQQAAYTDTTQFGSISQLLDFSKTWDYISQTIPSGGSQPYLWILPYFSIVMLIFTKSKWKYSIPLLIMVIGYTIPISKGFNWLRGMIFLIPLFSLLIGVAFETAWPWLSRFKGIRAATVAFVGFLFVSSALFDYAFVTSLSKKDPRYLVYDFLEGESQKKPIRVGLPPIPEFYGIFSFFDSKLIPNERINYLYSKNFSNDTLEWRKTDEPLPDYIILGSDFYGRTKELDEKISMIRATGRYEIASRYERKIEVLGMNFRLDPRYWDLYFPFPVFVVLKKV